MDQLTYLWLQYIAYKEDLILQTLQGNAAKIAQVKQLVDSASARLKAAMATSPHFQPMNPGANPLSSLNPRSSPVVIDDLVAAVQAEDTVIQSAITFIAGVPQLIQTAVNQALAGGATAAQLAPLTNLVADIQSKTAALQAAVTANTPTPTP